VAGKPGHHVLAGRAVEEVARVIPAELPGSTRGLVVAAGVLLGMSSSFVPAWNSSAAGAALPTKLISSIGRMAASHRSRASAGKDRTSSLGVILPSEMAHQAAVADGQHIGLEAILHSGQQPAHGGAEADPLPWTATPSRSRLGCSVTPSSLGPCVDCQAEATKLLVGGAGQADLILCGTANTAAACKRLAAATWSTRSAPAGACHRYPDPT
jgi:hypothetical protein